MQRQFAGEQTALVFTAVLITEQTQLALLVLTQAMRTEQASESNGRSQLLNGLLIAG